MSEAVQFYGQGACEVDQRVVRSLRYIAAQMNHLVHRDLDEAVLLEVLLLAEQASDTVRNWRYHLEDARRRGW